MNVLLEIGYESTTMEAVAAHAGVAKKTVYRYAANRQELIGLAVREWTNAYAPALQAGPTSEGNAADVLRGILADICAQVPSDSAVRFFRLLTTEFPGKQELLATYQRNGIERGQQMLATWLAKQHEMGYLCAPEPARLSEIILSMAVAEPIRQMALGVRPSLPMGNVTAQLEACMDVLSRLSRAPGS